MRPWLMHGMHMLLLVGIPVGRILWWILRHYRAHVLLGVIWWIARMRPHLRGHRGV
jgi:hypothetical protein